MSQLVLESGEKVCWRPRAHEHCLSENMLAEALSRITSENRPFIEAEVDFGRIIGASICVATGSRDEIFYARRFRRAGFSRFVKNREPEPCSKVFVVLKRDKWSAEGYLLITAFVGGKPQPEPWDENYFSKQENPEEARQLSSVFWASHALVYVNEEDVMVETITTERPPEFLFI